MNKLFKVLAVIICIISLSANVLLIYFAGSKLSELYRLEHIPAVDMTGYYKNNDILGTMPMKIDASGTYTGYIDIFDGDGRQISHEDFEKLYGSIIISDLNEAVRLRDRFNLNTGGRQYYVLANMYYDD